MPQMHQIHCVCSVREICTSGLNLEHTGFSLLMQVSVIPWIPTLVYSGLRREKGSPENNAIFIERDNEQICASHYALYVRTCLEFYSGRIYYFYL